ncbi:helix-turn-helix domain-containing protein [Oscillospiraceae bacterium OttesenSCG-928-G22]|nr:helix-turn-helix domain-containing protein [Oscillospiraceae bacterium OttesenSCG-928-G22]
MNANEHRYKVIGLHIAYYRKLKGLTQAQLAEMAEITTKHLSKIESPSNVQPVSLKTIFAIADACEQPVSVFFADI